tara:strand:+ start:961 stop:1419 length:459 start_codon:yes stop_codon:yes gene_type:complete
MKPIAPTAGNKDIGNGQQEHIKSNAEMNVALSDKLIKLSDKMNDQTIDLATRSLEARRILDWHCNHVKESWIEWSDQTNKVLEQIRQTRVVIGIESKQLLAECGDVRKFFLSDDHEKEIAKLREFIELCERLRALKNDGTLDKVADTILKLA